MESDDEPKSMWEASIKFILENYRGTIELWRARLPELFEKYEQKHGITRRVDIPLPKLPVDKPKGVPYDNKVGQPVKKVKLPRLKCLRCGVEWTAKSNKLPIQCTKCKSPYWNTPRKNDK